MQSALNVGECLRTYILMKYLKSITPVLENNSVTDACRKNPMNNYNIRGHLETTVLYHLERPECAHILRFTYIYIFIHITYT